MVKVIVGMMGSSVASGSSAMASPEQVREFLDAVKSFGVKEIDTARVYNAGKSEELLGDVGADKDFLIATKAPGFSPGSLAPENIIDNCNKSLAALKMDKVDIYYFHGPDSTIPLKDQCRAIGQLYKEGKFDKFGVSNLSPEQVDEICEICESEGYPKPAVYQGGYNPLGSGYDKTLFPTLKKHGMAFYAFSPLAGGALAKSISEIQNPGKDNRFSQMPVFAKLYGNETNVALLKKLTKESEENNMSVMEATMRWFMHHAPLTEQDGVILGASSTAQIKASLTATQKGPLPQSLVEVFDEMREKAKTML